VISGRDRKRDRARALAGEWRGRADARLVQTDAVVPLSRREREVALLAGQASRARTSPAQLFPLGAHVDNHLQRAYTKLGVTSRAELADALEATP